MMGVNCLLALSVIRMLKVIITAAIRVNAVLMA
jgi:hypothetical protein